MLKTIFLSFSVFASIHCQLPALIIDEGDILSLDMASTGEIAIITKASSDFVTQGAVSDLEYTMMSLISSDLTWNTNYESQYTADTMEGKVFIKFVPYDTETIRILQITDSQIFIGKIDFTSSSNNQYFEVAIPSITLSASLD